MLHRCSNLGRGVPGRRLGLAEPIAYLVADEFSIAVELLDVHWRASDGRMADMSAIQIATLVRREVADISDPVLREALEKLLVDPYCAERAWDYGYEGQTYPCWMVIEHPASNTGIAYCSEGFGPSTPWGLVFLSGVHMSIGMDSAWYASLEDAFRLSASGKSFRSGRRTVHDRGAGH